MSARPDLNLPCRVHTPPRDVCDTSCDAGIGTPPAVARRLYSRGYISGSLRHVDGAHGRLGRLANHPEVRPCRPSRIRLEAPASSTHHLASPGGRDASYTFECLASSLPGAQSSHCVDCSAPSSYRMRTGGLDRIPTVETGKTAPLIPVRASRLPPSRGFRPGLPGSHSRGDHPGSLEGQQHCVIILVEGSREGR